MSVVERLDMFSASLPRMCLYCAFGYPVVFGLDSWLDVLACGGHLVEGLRSKKATLHAPGSGYVDCDGSSRNAYMPMVGPRDRCGSFRPVRMTGGGGGFANSRKFDLLDRSGLFDGMEWKGAAE